MKVTKFTKALLDFMLWAGILAAFSLPVSLKILGDFRLEKVRREMGRKNVS